ncbi:MAG: hypothetical protein RL430_1190, partial [Actinomycetota bacterium]
EFVRNTGLYDEVVAYDDIESLEQVPSVVVDRTAGAALPSKGDDAESVLGFATASSTSRPMRTTPTEPAIHGATRLLLTRSPSRREK